MQYLFCDMRQFETEFLCKLDYELFPIFDSWNFIFEQSKALNGIVNIFLEAISIANDISYIAYSLIYSHVFGEFVDAVLAHFSYLLTWIVCLLVHADQIRHKHLLYVDRRHVIFEEYSPVLYFIDLIDESTSLRQEHT